MIKVDVSLRPYRVAELHHYAYAYFNNNIASKIVGGNTNWASATGQQSCAMRMSIALAYAGVHWPRIKNSWQLKDTKVFFPSFAGDYPSMLKDPETINSS